MFVRTEKVPADLLNPFWNKEVFNRSLFNKIWGHKSINYFEMEESHFVWAQFWLVFEDEPIECQPFFFPFFDFFLKFRKFVELDTDFFQIRYYF